MKSNRSEKKQSAAYLKVSERASALFSVIALESPPDRGWCNKQLVCLKID